MDAVVPVANDKLTRIICLAVIVTPPGILVERINLATGTSPDSGY
jgi:hypothetical protein